MARLAMLSGICLFTAGAQFSCSSDGTVNIGDDDLDSGDGPRFVTRLVLRNSSGTETYSFQRGDLITLEVTIRNRTGETIRLQGCCPPESDFFVFDDGNEDVRWQWSEGRAFPAVVADLVFTPNEAKTMQVTWNQVTRSGEMLSTGQYDARGIVTRAPFLTDPLAASELGSNLRTFTIR
ncbi:MAG: hypothetical protein H7Y89_07710 [Steroidobacteraceae bacterium]|nr:hypothetical protein [Steroidobacteraceae bacterium]